MDSVASFSPSHSPLSCPCLDTLFADNPPFEAIDKLMVVTILYSRVLIDYLHLFLACF
jgi:hypothetical protein